MHDDPTTPGTGEEPVAGPGATFVGDETDAAAQFAPPGEGPEILDAEVALAADAETEAEDVPEPEPDWKDHYLRSAAELENVRKRARRDVGVAEARGTSRLARELLPALDNLDRAIAAAEAEETDQEHHLTKGIRLVQAELVAALSRVGIMPFDPTGEAFDPHRHEAIAQAPREGVEAGVIIEVYQQGYRFGDDVLRPAKVVVAA